MRKWRIEDSEELYNITGWGTSYFGINDKGHVVVTPRKDGVSVDLKELVDELQLRDVASPMLVRFPDILDNRIEKMSSCFKQAAEEYGYKAENFIIYPIKVNQMRPVVEEIISHGKKFNLGLEAGSKPELHAVIAVNTDSDSLIVCNGYKDESYIELALLAQKMGKRIFLVVEKMNERAQELGMTMDEVVTLASMIEKEAKKGDFAKVSAVFHNRLKADMTLGSDVTIKCATGSQKMVLGDSELSVNSAYNTYTRKGLPVGPICNPSMDAIVAALYPDEQYVAQKYLYFCSTDPASGALHFSKTLDEHNAAVAMYRPLWEEYDKSRGLN